jgi:hypothetical protein
MAGGHAGFVNDIAGIHPETLRLAAIPAKSSAPRHLRFGSFAEGAN